MVRVAYNNHFLASPPTPKSREICQAIRARDRSTACGRALALQAMVVPTLSVLAV